MNRGKSPTQARVALVLKCAGPGGMRRVKRSDTIRCEAGTAKLPRNVGVDPKASLLGLGGRLLTSALPKQDKKPSLQPYSTHKLIETETERTARTRL